VIMEHLGIGYGYRKRGLLGPFLSTDDEAAREERVPGFAKSCQSVSTGTKPGYGIKSGIYTRSFSLQINGMIGRTLRL